MSQSILDMDLLEEMTSASPSHMVVVLYDQAITSLEAAVTAIEEEDIEARCTEMTRTTEIVAHLYSNLDLDNGGAIADNLARLYRFILARLITVNTTNDPQPARDVIELLQPLLKSWREIDALFASGVLAETDILASAMTATADLEEEFLLGKTGS